MWSGPHRRFVTPEGCYSFRAVFGQPWLGRNGCQLSLSRGQAGSSRLKAVVKRGMHRRLNHLLFKVNWSWALAMNFWPGCSCCFSLPTHCANLTSRCSLDDDSPFYPCISHRITPQRANRKQEIIGESAHWPEGLPNPSPLGSQTWRQGPPPLLPGCATGKAE